MSEIRRGSLRNVTTAVYFAAECGVCGQRPDDDGAEFQGTPEEAVAVATGDHNYVVGDDGVLRCEECIGGSGGGS